MNLKQMFQDLHTNEGSSKLTSFFFILKMTLIDLQYVLYPIKLPRCKKWLKEGCVEQFDKINCGAAVSFCSQYLEVPFFDTGEFFLHH